MINHDSPKLNTLIDDEVLFESLMQKVDAKLSSEDVDPSMRMFGAISHISKMYDDCSISFTGPLAQKISDWFDVIYGNKMKASTYSGRGLVAIRNTPYRVTIPVIYGELEINILEFIDDATPNMLRRLNNAEINALAKDIGEYIQGYLRAEKYIGIARADIEASIDFIIGDVRDFGLSKWSSLQALEKAIKQSYSDITGNKAKCIHRLQELADALRNKGGVLLDPKEIDKVMCKPSVRYEKDRVTMSEAIIAHKSALKCIFKLGE